MRYEYECSKCEGYFEIEMKLADYVKISDGLEPPPNCPKCETPLKKIITQAPRFKLLGHGWYDMGYGITDMEMNSNLEEEKRVEGKAHKEMEKSTNVQEL